MIKHKPQLSSKTKLGMVIHVALDFFFCDRCVLEAKDNAIFRVWDKLCPVQYLFKLLPKEEPEKIRRIYFPRCWLERTCYHEGDKDET